MGGNMFYKMRKITAISIITIFLLNMFFSRTININVYAAEKVGTNMDVSAGHDENGGYHGGRPGDSTGEELYIRPWVSRTKNNRTMGHDVKIRKP